MTDKPQPTEVQKLQNEAFQQSHEKRKDFFPEHFKTSFFLPALLVFIVLLNLLFLFLSLG